MLDPTFDRWNSAGMRSEWHVVEILGGDTFRAPKECRAAAHRASLLRQFQLGWPFLIAVVWMLPWRVAPPVVRSGSALPCSRAVGARTDNLELVGTEKTCRTAGWNMEGWDAALRVAFLVLRAMRLGSTGRQQSRYSLHKLVWRTWMERSRLRCTSLAYFWAGWAIC